MQHVGCLGSILSFLLSSSHTGRGTKVVQAAKSFMCLQEVRLFTQAQFARWHLDSACT